MLSPVPPPEEPPRAKPLALGNIAHGRIAIGNVVSGFVAVGNVARGFIAIGNVAVGFIAIGNVSFGVIAIGATNAVGLVAGSFLNVVPAILSLGGMNVVPVVPYGFVALAVMVAGSYLAPGRRAEVALPEGPRAFAKLLPPGEVGWEPVTIVGIEGSSLRFRAGKVTRQAEADADVLVAARGLLAQGAPDAIASLSWRVLESSTHYRELGPESRVLECRSLRPATAPIAPWATSRELQWYLARGFRIAAAVGFACWLALLILARAS